ncbi:MAG: hypothetical protein ACI7YS_04200 [Flavobacterium sp.]
MKNYFSQWNFMRFVRLAFAIYLTFEVVATRQWFLAVFALLFYVQALFNIGCCSTNSCNVSSKRNKNC